MNPQAGLSIVRGVPLAEEPGLGALTLPGFRREVCTRYPDREALVEHRPDGAVLRWTYAELWTRAMVVGATLASGGSIVLQRTFDPAEALRLMAAERVTFLFAWPHQWSNWSAHRGLPEPIFRR